MSASSVLAQCRELGLAMGGRYAPNVFALPIADGGEQRLERTAFVGWTTDEAKAYAAEEAGAKLRPYQSQDPRFSGWEVVVHDDVPL